MSREWWKVQRLDVEGDPYGLVEDVLAVSAERAACDFGDDGGSKTIDDNLELEVFVVVSRDGVEPVRFRVVGKVRIDWLATEVT